ncbi:centromere protein J [Hyperolius riggenbachi]|uniref:centromere protein J n=1 Tax=Hyperolius riggenbachi TaxID=752182 RepID=UPI0035A35891
MPEMISSPDFEGDPNFLAQYMSTITRAGVIVNPAFPILEKDGGLQRRPSSALSGFRVPTPQMGASSFMSEDSLEQLGASYQQPEMHLDMKGHTPVYRDPDREGSRSRPQSRAMFREDEVLREELNDPLLKKLEQLKEIQQQKQEQLKQRQMEQLQKLMEEQKMLLNLSRQPVYSEHGPQNPVPGQLGSSISQRGLSRLMSPVSGNVPRDYFYRKHELGKKDRGSSSRPSSVLAEERSPEKSKTLEDLLKEEDAEDYSEDEGDTEESAHEDASVEQLRQNDPEAEERPIVSSIKERKKSFEEFLEEQMRIEEQRLQQKDPTTQSTEGHVKSKPVQKRPFLRRGEGLARFKSGNQKPLIRQDAKSESQKQPESTAPPRAEKAQVHRKTVQLPKEQGAENNSGATKLNQNARDKMAVINKKPLKNRIKNGTSSAHGKEDNKSTSSGRSSMSLERHTSLEMDKENVDNSKSADSLNTHIAKVRDSGNPNDSPQISNLHTKSTNPGELSFEISFQRRKAHWEKEKHKENYELNEFVLLEQAAEDISFSSNSSFVQKLLNQDYLIDDGQRRLSSTPVKAVGRLQEKGVNSIMNANSAKLNQKTEELGSFQKNPSGALSVGLDERTGKVTSELLKGFGNAVKISSKDSEPATSEGDYASSMDEHNHSGLSENDDLDSEDSSREDDPKSDELNGPSKKLSKETKGRDLDLDLSDGDDREEDQTLLANKSKVTMKDESSSSESEVGFDDERTWDDLGNVPRLKGIYESNFVSKEFIPSEYTSRSPPDVPDKAITRKVASKKGDVVKAATGNMPGPSPASELMMKLFPALKPKAKPELQTTAKAAPVQEGPGDSARSQLLKEKLVELETEIERFKMENASLARLREDKEKTLETLRKEVTDFEQKKAMELARIEEYKKEEMKKLQNERKVFEKYASAARAMPDKKEREEILNLKQQVKELQEELKKKETKWSTTHVRLRNQIETLTKENSELREEIKFMEKVRLEMWKKSESGETRKKASEGPAQLLKRSESMSPLHLLKQRRTPAPEPERNTKVLRSQSPIKGLSSRSFRQASLGESSHSELPRVKMADPAASTLSQISDKLPSTEGRMESVPVKDRDDIQGEVTYPDGKTERILRNGCHVILFPNGTRKEVSADGKSTTVTFFNGDVKQVLADQRVIYYYADAQTTHTTYPDGIEILQFSNGQIEKHFPDGKKEITFPDQTIKNLHPDGKEESIFPDGTIITSNVDGTKLIQFDNGQRELHTPQYKRREYPDGTVKTVYTNGQQETKYASGRVRVKDKDGNVIMDTKM